MYRKQNNKRAVETFLVSSGDAAIYNTAGSGNHINNTSTGAARLADGQLGFFSATDYGTVALNVATDATPTVTEAPMIYIAQGTADSANPATAQANATYPLVARPYERSGDISSESRILATKQAYVAPTNSIWVVGDTGALATGGLTAEDNTEYTVSIAYRGYVVDEDFNPTATKVFKPTYTTPNYTSLGTTNPLDHLIQNLLWDVNRNSRILALNQEGNEPVVGIALDLTGTAGTAVGSLSPGYQPLVNTTAGTRGLTLTAADITMLQAALPSGSSIVTVDTTTAGASANGANAFALMALDRPLVYNDRIKWRKVRLEVAMTAGFDWQQVYYDETEEAFEGEGLGRHLHLDYIKTHGQRKYFGLHRQVPIINYDSPFSLTETYNRYTIEYANLQQVDTFNYVSSPQRLVVAIPSGDTTTVGQWDTALDSWLTSAGSNLVTLS